MLQTARILRNHARTKHAHQLVDADERLSHDVNESLYDAFVFQLYRDNASDNSSSDFGKQGGERKRCVHVLMAEFMDYCRRKIKSVPANQIID